MTLSELLLLAILVVLILQNVAALSRWLHNTSGRIGTAVKRRRLGRQPWHKKHS